MKIILALDSSAESQVAVAEVAARPWPQGTAVEVTSVVDLTYGWNAPGLSEALMQSAESAVRSAAERIKLAGLTSSRLVLTGDPKATVVDHAAQAGADLLVVGSHEHSDVARFLLGSVARSVVRHASCSVEIVRPRSSDGAMKLLLATDGSKCSLDAARSIAARPWPKGTEVRIVSVVELSPAWFRAPYPAYFDPKAMEDLRGSAMKAAQKAIAEAEETIQAAGLAESGTVCIPTASPQEMILQEATAWGADMIVVGSHGRRGASRFLLGSVSEPIAYHANCSVEIIRSRP